MRPKGSSSSVFPPAKVRFAAALRGTFAEGYSGHKLRSDVLAGLTVGIVALPLSMALAIASGVPPQYGLYTAIVAGAIAALCGGSRTSVTGPTAAFVVLLVPVSSQYGLAGLLIATLLAGGLLIAMGVARMGRLIQYIPHPVTTGFTAGIAVVIATLQVKDFLGLEVGHMPEHYVERVAVLARAIPTTHLSELLLGAGTLALLIVFPKLTRKVPALLVAVTLAAVIAYVGRQSGWFHVETIGDRFTYAMDGGQTGRGIPQLPPLPGLPWNFPGPNGEPLTLSWDLVQGLLGPAFAIAILGAIESLLCAVIADGMANTKHDPDSELIGQGIANVVAPFFGGFAATGAIARSAANIRSGGRSPIAAFTHALFVLTAMVALAPLLAWLPMAALAAMLLVVAWNMSEARHFVRTIKTAPRSDVMVLLSCFALTVIFDMVIAVGVGVVLAALLFMKRMAEISSTQLLHERHPHLVADLPENVRLYEIAGPLFFGAAEKAVSAITAIAGRADTVILEMSAVPVIDATGLVALKSAIAKLQRTGTLVVLAGVKPKPYEVLERGGLHNEPGRLHICGSLQEAEMFVRLLDHDADAARPAVAPALH